VASKPQDVQDESRMQFQLMLRRRGISDHAVLHAMEEVPREQFVGPEFAERAYDDQAQPIACGQTISQPYVVAYMTEQLALRPHHRVLEVGTGSGYQAAVLSRLVREVVSVERYRTLADQARARLRALGYDNVTVVVGDGFVGVPGRAPYDRIIVTAAADRSARRRRRDDPAARAAERSATPRQADQDADRHRAPAADPGSLRPLAAGYRQGTVTFLPASPAASKRDVTIC
jgi:protein-L-isoaspartate(D-aspartate) O-methyltransferase